MTTFTCDNCKCKDLEPRRVGMIKRWDMTLCQSCFYSLEEELPYRMRDLERELLQYQKREREAETN